MFETYGNHQSIIAFRSYSNQYKWRYFFTQYSMHHAPASVINLRSTKVSSGSSCSKISCRVSTSAPATSTTSNPSRDPKHSQAFPKPHQWNVDTWITAKYNATCQYVHGIYYIIYISGMYLYHIFLGAQCQPTIENIQELNGSDGSDVSDG